MRKTCSADQWPGRWGWGSGISCCARPPQQRWRFILGGINCVWGPHKTLEELTSINFRVNLVCHWKRVESEKASPEKHHQLIPVNQEKKRHSHWSLATQNKSAWLPFLSTSCLHVHSCKSSLQSVFWKLSFSVRRKQHSPLGKYLLISTKITPICLPNTEKSVQYCCYIFTYHKNQTSFLLFFWNFLLFSRLT